MADTNFSLPLAAGDIRDDFLTDVRLEMINNGATLADANLAVQPGTFTHILATSFGNGSYVTRSAYGVSAADLTPETCGPVILEQWRRALRLPDVSNSPSTGRIVVSVTGTATIPNGREFVLPNGLRGRVVGTWPSVSDGDEVDAITIDTGNATRFPGGTAIRFINPPLNVSRDATVSYSQPLDGGTDTETTERLRTRVLNRLAFAMGGASWGHLRGIALDALAQVQDCYVYPALGGPASCKIVPVRGYDVELRQFTRALNDAALRVVRNAVHVYAPDMCQYVVQTAANQATNIALQVTLPAAAQAGGNGNGWTDTLVWPQLAGGDQRVLISTVTSQTDITLSASTTVSPIPGLTRIAWWSKSGKEFVVRVVTGVTGGTGAWRITLDRPLIDGAGNGPEANDYVSPAATNIEAYGRTWVDIFGQLGPGENVTVSDNRRKRHPFEADGSRSSLTAVQLKQFAERHTEVLDYSWSYRSLSAPSVPALITDPPNILTLNRFGIYPL